MHEVDADDQGIRTNPTLRTRPDRSLPKTLEYGSLRAQ
jgi:hypothetical protein